MSDEYRCPIRMQHLSGWDALDALPTDQQAEVWAQLRVEAERRTDGIAHHDEVVDLPVKVPPRPVRAWTPRPLAVGSELDDIPTVDYVQALTGVEVDTRRAVCCPFPDHDDSSASFKAYDDGFNCFGCNRGGRIFDFAAALWGYSPPLRGDTFREVRDRLLDVLGYRAAA